MATEIIAVDALQVGAPDVLVWYDEFDSISQTAWENLQVDKRNLTPRTARGWDVEGILRDRDTARVERRAANRARYERQYKRRGEQHGR